MLLDNINGVLKLVYHLDPIWIYVFVAIICYIENVIPPIPGDILLVFCGYLSGIGHSSWVITFLFAFVGSIIGFMTLHIIGRFLDDEIIQSRKWSWLPYKSIDKIDSWFRRYGIIILIINRFLMGIRSAISIVSGMAKIDFIVATLSASVSIIIWNAGLILSGKWLGDNWKAIQPFLIHYQRILTILTAIIILSMIARYLWKILRKTKVA
jgi:membrane protein DedA with SNARE-associated domain